MANRPRDLESRFIVVTGANTGIGRISALRLAERGAHVVLACRSREKTDPVLTAIRDSGGTGEWVELDLADLTQVRRCAQELLLRERPIDVLLNNAGLAGQRGQTRQGFELTFGTNHLGHFLLTVLLMPRLRAGARIVNVSSRAHYDAKGIDFEALRAPTRSVTGMPEYQVSKLANVLFTKELSRRIGPTGVRSYALHPGVVATDVWRRIPWPFRAAIKAFMIKPEEGAETSLYCATSPEVADHDGRYYDTCRERPPSKVSQDAPLARALWDKSVEWAGADLPADPARPA